MRCERTTASLTSRALHAAAVSLLFLVCYSGTNQLAAHRTHVPTLYAAIELSIPLWRWMLLPYFSIDLLFVAAFLICRDRDELRTLSRRTAAAIVIACACFALFPLRLGYAPQQFDGVSGAALAMLARCSQYNLAPSLHVGLGLILLEHYRQRVRTVALKAIVLIWFALLIAATVFTHQHHVFDLPTGAFLAAFCCWMFPHDAPRSARRNNSRIDIAAIYAVAAVLCTFAATMGGGWWWLLSWPALALGLVALAYARGDAMVFRKCCDGALPVSSRVIFAPVLLGCWCWRFFYRLKDRPMIVEHGMVSGGLPLRAAARRLLDMRVTAVLDLAAECAETSLLRGPHYLSVPILDFTTASEQDLSAAIAFVRSQRAQNRIVYVHCALGRCRAKQVIAAWHASQIGVRRDEQDRIKIMEKPRATPAHLASAPGRVLGPVVG